MREKDKDNNDRVQKKKLEELKWKKEVKREK